MAGQVSLLDTTTTLSNLVHEVFTNRVEPIVEYLDPVAGIFREGKSGKDYRLEGSKLVGFLDYNFIEDMMATNGYLPDHSTTDGVRWETTPSRLYLRRAFDEMELLRINQPGAYEDLAGRTERHAIQSWKRSTGRHVHGSSAGTVAVVDSRTSATVVVVKDGYGHVGTNPTLHIRKGMRLASLDASASYAVLATAKVSSVAHGTKTVTFEATIEGAGTIASGDLLVVSSSTDSTATNFVTERGRAPLGLRDHLDPDSANSSYLTMTEATYPETKPVRKTSSDFGEVELMAFKQELMAQGGSEVTESSHVFTTHPGITHELARTLIGFTQIQQKGQTLNGGWTTVKIAGLDWIESGYHSHDEVMAHCKADYFCVKLGNASVDGQVATPDGQKFSRLADYDGKEYYMRTYLQRIVPRRNRSGTLKGISNPNADTFAAVPR